MPRLVLLVAGILTGVASGEPALKDQDRVVFVGDTLIERDGRFGQTETMLLHRATARRLIIRNLGWSGDTPAGLSRAYFDPPEAGYQRLIEQINACRPTVVVVGYGLASALEGVPTDRFLSEMDRLVEGVQPPPREWVFLSPLVPTAIPAGPPELVAALRLAQEYSQAIRPWSEKRKGTYVDLAYDPAEWAGALEPNGIHLNEEGYRRLAERLMTVLVRPPAPPQGSVDPDPQGELRRLVNRKNALYFERYRPQNITYLLGFRAYEQGQNAREIEALDPVIAQLEVEIEALRPAVQASPNRTPGASR